MLFDCSSELLKKFRYPWEMMPIMYALAKYSNGNIDEIMQKIDEGKLNTSVGRSRLKLQFSFRAIRGERAASTSNTQYVLWSCSELHNCAGHA